MTSPVARLCAHKRKAPNNVQFHLDYDTLCAMVERHIYNSTAKKVKVVLSGHGEWGRITIENIDDKEVAAALEQMKIDITDISDELIDDAVSHYFGGPASANAVGNENGVWFCGPGMTIDVLMTFDDYQRRNFQNVMQ